MDQNIENPLANCDALNLTPPESICFGTWRFTPESGELENGERLRRLEPVVGDVLTLLLKNAGRVVSREQILQSVWKDKVVVDESVSRAISRIRTALGDTKKPRRYIQTLPKRGYRLIWSSPTDTTSPE